MTVLQQKISKLQNKQKSDNAEIHRLQQKIRDQNKTIARLNEINDHKIKLDNDKKREIKALHKQMEKLERNYASTFSEITKESESMIDDKHKEIRNLQMALNNHRANILVPLTVIGINMNEILKLRVKPMMTIAQLASRIRGHRPENRLTNAHQTHISLTKFVLDRLS
eukprot:248703_1